MIEQIFPLAIPAAISYATDTLYPDNLVEANSYTSQVFGIALAAADITTCSTQDGATAFAAACSKTYDYLFSIGAGF